MFGNAKQGAPASSLKIAPCVALCGEQPLQHLQHEKHEFQLSSAPYNMYSIKSVLQTKYIC
jgi:hypothetical protein